MSKEVKLNGSLSDEIRANLQGNPSVFYAGEIINRSNGQGFFREEARIIVSPIIPEFNIRKLNDFMANLVPGIQPYLQEKAKPHNSSGIKIGSLTFDEQIVPPVKSNPEFYGLQGLVRLGSINVLLHELPDAFATRRTSVLVYPEPVSANSEFEYESARQLGIPECGLDPSIALAKYWLGPQEIRQLRGLYVQTFRQIVNDLARILLPI